MLRVFKAFVFSINDCTVKNSDDVLQQSVV